MGKKEKRKKNNLPNRKQAFFSFVKRIMRLFYKKPQIIYFGEQKIEQTSIIVSNHVALKGPVMHELYLPVFTAKWGAGEMLGNYKSRYKYLRNVFYMQKRGFGKARSTFCAAIAALFSKFFYKGMHIIPTWHDARMYSTIRHSLDILSDGTSMLIFPENSDAGYKDVITEFRAGFVTLAKLYYKKTGNDIPVFPVYYHHKKKYYGYRLANVRARLCKPRNDKGANSAGILQRRQCIV